MRGGRLLAILVVVLGLALVGGAAAAYTQLRQRDAQIAQTQADLATARADAATAHSDLRREQQARAQAEQTATERAAELAQTQQKLDAALAAAQTAQANAAALSGQVASLQSQLAQAQQRPSAATPPTNAQAAQAVLALDDQLLNEATTFMRHTADAEQAIRASNYTALGAAFSEMQASRARWAALVAQRNQAVARLHG